MDERRRRFVLEKMEPWLMRLLTPRALTAALLVALALAQLDRPDALLARHIETVTRGAVTAAGMAAVLAAHGLYVWFRRPEAGWYLFATWPLAALALAAWHLRIVNPDVSLTIPVLAACPVLFAAAFALYAGRPGRRDHEL